MTWILWVVVGLLILGAITTVLSIGAERKPITPGMAVVTVIVTALYCWAIIAVGIF